VAADAIYYVQDTAPTDAFTWTPAIPSAGSWRILVRWPASSANTAAARYTVTHAGGTTVVTLNQKQNGGIWNSLGTYSLTPGAGHKVTLAASTDGTTIADALLFAGPTVQPANLLYVHADHLGSPQKLTTPSQAIAWDGMFDPFGKEVAITGLAAMPLRFPGQYADDETGYSYNYFRDYDPTVGRYIQSDPIGLAAGANTYVYVSGNPIRYEDATGELGPVAAALLYALQKCATGAVAGAAIEAGIQVGKCCYKQCGYKFWQCNPLECGINACDVAAAAISSCVASAAVPNAPAVPVTWALLKPFLQKLGFKQLLNHLGKFGCS